MCNRGTNLILQSVELGLLVVHVFQHVLHAPQLFLCIVSRLRDGRIARHLSLYFVQEGRKSAQRFRKLLALFAHVVQFGLSVRQLRAQQRIAIVNVADLLLDGAGI